MNSSLLEAAQWPSDVTDNKKATGSNIRFRQTQKHTQKDSEHIIVHS